MKATCTADKNHKRFITVAHVTEDWVVNEHGEFEEVCENSDTQVLHGPDIGNEWTCAICHAVAKVEVE